MITFPLYEILNREYDTLSRKPELTNSEKEELISMIKQCSEREHELIFVLIRYFQKDSEKHLNPVPYNAKMLKKGIKFDLNEFPQKLQLLIHLFLKKHFQDN